VLNTTDFSELSLYTSTEEKMESEILIISSQKD